MRRGHRGERGLVVTCLGLCAACAVPKSARERAVAPEPVPSASIGTPAPEAPEAETAPEVSAAVERVSRIRALAVRRPVRVQRLSRDAMARRVHEHIDREVPPSVIAGQTALLVGLGLVPPEFDYVATIIELMGTQLAGFYEPADGTMYLADDLAGVDARITLAHELVHALQDQHYDLKRMIEYQPSEGDAQAAAHALAEGDATSAMLDELLGDQGAKATDLSDAALRLQISAGVELSVSIATVPSIIKRSVISPYVDGVGFVHALRREGGWSAVDAAWREPPMTTEQVLHPEKYASHEPPLPIAVAAAPEGWRAEPLYTDKMGEQTLRLVFEEWMPRVAAEAAAAGWGGDRVSVFREGGDLATAWEFRFDTDSDASEAASAFHRALGAGRAPPTDWLCQERADRQIFGVWFRERDLRVALGSLGGGGCDAARVWVSRWAPGQRRD